jgi:hypothetical protein
MARAAQRSEESEKPHSGTFAQLQGGDISLTSRTDEWGIRGLYNWRFVCIPLESFAEVLGIDLADADKHIQELDSNVFFEFISKAHQENQLAGAAIFQEELLHHRHTRQTSTWIFLQILSLLCRLSFAYLSFRIVRESPSKLIHDNDFTQVLSLLVNSFLGGQAIKQISFPVIEGFAHYKDIMTRGVSGQKQIEETYGTDVSSVAQKFAMVAKLLSDKYGNQSDSVVSWLAIALLDLPFTSNRVFWDASYETLRKTFSNASLQPLKRFNEALGILSKPLPTASSDLIGELSSVLSTSGSLDKTFALTLLWYGAHANIPDALIWFAFERVLASRYFVSTLAPLLADTIVRRGRGIESYTYQDMPGIWVYSTRASLSAPFDPAVRLLKRRALVATHSFEWEVRGSNPTYTENLYLEALVMQFLMFKRIQDFRIDKYLDFIAKWVPFIGQNKAEFQKWFSEFDDYISELYPVLANTEKTDFKRETFAKFAERYLLTIASIQNRLHSGDWRPCREFVLALANTSYIHGF